MTQAATDGETLNGMTDYPRFEPVRSAPDEAHLDYHGGRLVDCQLSPSVLEIKWMPVPPSVPPGAQVAMLHGDPSKEGLFSFRLKFPSGYVIRRIGTRSPRSPQSSPAPSTWDGREG